MAASLPSFELPSSTNVVDVRVIDSTARLRIPMTTFVKDHVPSHDFLECPAYSFLIEHSSGQKLIFDLGLRKDIGASPPAVIQSFVAESEKSGASVTVDTDVASVLKEASIDLNDIKAIIWSHWHLDHSGDPSTFPPTTSLVVGPGFKDVLLPGYPANPEGLILETDYKGRELHEIDFNSHSGATKIGDIRAVDYFQDGSFFLLDSPGHTVGHMAALARTTPSTFVLMGADTAHHCGSFRPSQYLPLPENISPSPFSNPPFLPGSICPGEVLVKVHPQQVRDKPFYQNLSEAPDRNVAEAEKSVGKVIELDARDDVFVVVAHDSTLLDVINFFPDKVNDWKENGWKEKSRWRFLKDFHGAVEAQSG
ncbi:Lactamase-B domain-containing protein [Fusarium falciforme]|uniref:Lactamase-B domain-containing protein n=1 Tax=Fusarium falciforme TaxID=195108 RepID=UPI002300DCD7|nr:Lactamase-B domain-containing protein [Fusarium falciforme]WAO95518.1 Lactamase-B domain-containing protein [Fusarium falciforme]